MSSLTFHNFKVLWTYLELAGRPMVRFGDVVKKVEFWKKKQLQMSSTLSVIQSRVEVAHMCVDYIQDVS